MGGQKSECGQGQVFQQQTLSGPKKNDWGKIRTEGGIMAIEDEKERLPQEVSWRKEAMAREE